MPYAFADITYQNQDNVGGIPGRIYYADWTDIATYSKRPLFSAITTPESGALMTDPPVMKSTKAFHKLDINNEKASVVAKAQGEKGGMSVKTTLKFTLDGLTERNSGFRRLAQNGRMAFIVPDLDTGKYYAVGCTEYSPAVMSSDGEDTTGEGASGHKSCTFSFESNDVCLMFLELTDVELTALLTAAT